MKLTTRTGAHAAVVGPDDATVADVYSNARTPPEVLLGRKGGDAAARQVTQSTRRSFRTYAWREPKVVQFEARDGTKVPARLFTPEEVGAVRDPLRPGVVFVHGAGWLQNAHRYWSQYYREYMFHHLLAVARLRGAGRRLPRQRGLRPRLAHGRRGPHGRARPERRGGRRGLPRRAGGRRPEAHRRLRRQLRRLHHADGAVHLARHLRGGRRAPAGDRLGALQPRLHVEHPGRAAGRRRRVPEELAHPFRRRPQGRRCSSATAWWTRTCTSRTRCGSRRS